MGPGSLGPLRVWGKEGGGEGLGSALQALKQEKSLEGGGGGASSPGLEGRQQDSFLEEVIPKPDPES